MDYEELNMQRYATKKFDGKKVSKEVVDKIKEIVRFSPSSFNFQPWKIKVIDDNDMFVELEKASLFNKQISNCSHLFVFCVPKDLEEKKSKLLELMGENGMPQETLDFYDNLLVKWFENYSEQDKINFATNQAYIALENLMMAAKSFGVDSCPIEGFEKDKYQKYLEIPEEYVPVVICPIGYGADEKKSKLRFDSEEIYFQ
ncbi:MAG: NAD(P)H-dependent oxidoreductase [Candidatus Woesearchaeota archaeon]|jgi:nitroreductase/dihydropteridine reductase|nr:NAD(P)H-dependent oxidoreductase [Candidatus Woesearchaeota archaeon]